jgi:hypothetical protein
MENKGCPGIAVILVHGFHEKHGNDRIFKGVSVVSVYSKEVFTEIPNEPK